MLSISSSYCLVCSILCKQHQLSAFERWQHEPAGGVLGRRGENLLILFFDNQRKQCLTRSWLDHSNKYFPSYRANHNRGIPRIQSIGGRMDCGLSGRSKVFAFCPVLLNCMGREASSVRKRWLVAAPRPAGSHTGPDQCRVFQVRPVRAHGCHHVGGRTDPD